MSTAIALQNISPSGHNNGTIRHRTTKANTTASTPTAEPDAWLDTPHDDHTIALPLDNYPFAPTSTYWISPHGMLTQDITILDLTLDLDVPYSGLTDDYKAEVKKALKDHSCTSALTCHRNSWVGLTWSIKDDQDSLIAEWKHPWFSTGEATLTFPETSPHSSHPIRLRNKRWGLRSETFTLDSQPFVWEMDSIWHSTNMTLYKVADSGEYERKTEVGKFAQKWWGGIWTGGTVVVDEGEVDGCVACLTLCVVLKKKRQRAGERRHAGD